VPGLAGDVVGAGAVEDGDVLGREGIGDQRRPARIVVADPGDDCASQGGRERVHGAAVDEDHRPAVRPQPCLVGAAMKLIKVT